MLLVDSRERYNNHNSARACTVHSAIELGFISTETSMQPSLKDELAGSLVAPLTPEELAVATDFPGAVWIRWNAQASTCRQLHGQKEA